MSRASAEDLLAQSVSCPRHLPKPTSYLSFCTQLTSGCGTVLPALVTLPFIHPFSCHSLSISSVPGQDQGWGHKGRRNRLDPATWYLWSL